MSTQLTLADALAPLSLPVVSVEKHVEDGQVRGMWVEFANGMTLSVQWRGGSYSNVGRGSFKPERGDEPTFEAAAWYPAAFDMPWVVDGENWGTKRKWFNPDPRYHGDDILPYVTVAEVMEFARKVAAHVLL